MKIINVHRLRLYEIEHGLDHHQIATASNLEYVSTRRIFASRFYRATDSTFEKLIMGTGMAASELEATHKELNKALAEHENGIRPLKEPDLTTIRKALATTKKNRRTKA